MAPEWIKSVIGNIVVGWIFGILYVTGLTLLFPFLFFLQVSGPTSPIVLVVAVIMIIASFFGYLGRYHDIGSTLKALGRITLIPGLLGIFFSLFGRVLITAMLEGRGLAQDVLLRLVLIAENIIPKVWVLTIIYVFIGILMWYVGYRLERR